MLLGHTKAAKRSCTTSPSEGTCRGKKINPAHRRAVQREELQCNSLHEVAAAVESTSAAGSRQQTWLDWITWCWVSNACLSSLFCHQFSMVSQKKLCLFPFRQFSDGSVRYQAIQKRRCYTYVTHSFLFSFYFFRFKKGKSWSFESFNVKGCVHVHLSSRTVWECGKRTLEREPHDVNKRRWQWSSAVMPHPHLTVTDGPPVNKCSLARSAWPDTVTNDVPLPSWLLLFYFKDFVLSFRTRAT